MRCSKNHGVGRFLVPALRCLATGGPSDPYGLKAPPVSFRLTYWRPMGGAMLSLQLILRSFLRSLRAASRCARLSLRVAQGSHGGAAKRRQAAGEGRRKRRPPEHSEYVAVMQTKQTMSLRPMRSTVLVDGRVARLAHLRPAALAAAAARAARR